MVLSYGTHLIPYIICELNTNSFYVKLLAWGLHERKGNEYMAGTKEGGKKAAAKNVARDANFYANIGSKGGAAKVSKGFAANPELARKAGAKGGAISRRGKAQKTA